MVCQTQPHGRILCVSADAEEHCRCRKAGSSEVAVVLKSSREIEKMRRAGKVVREVLELVRSQVKPGATTLDLEKGG